MKKLIDAYLYSIDPKDNQTLRFLVFLRNKSKIYSGQWRMVGGKVQENETYWKAALREIREETSLIPNEFWVIPSLNQFYEPQTDLILSIPAFAARIPLDADIKLNDEHSEYKWIGIQDIHQYIPWPEQRRLMHVVYDIIRSKGILEQWKIPL
jgi:8-oxo-dGTP pyrophosphatase MutT (NUDIX family)